MTVGERIQTYRKKTGLSQEELGQQLLVSRQTVSLWETGQTLPTVDNLMRLREIFGVPVDALLFADPQAPCVPHPRESYPLQRLPAYGRWLIAACVLSLLQLAVCITVTALLLSRTVWGGVYVTLSLLGAVGLTATLLLHVRREKQAEHNSYRLDIYEDCLRLIRCDSTDRECTQTLPLDAPQGLGQTEDRLLFRLGRERFALCREALASDSRLQPTPPRRRLTCLSLICALLALLTVSGSGALLLQQLAGDPIRRATRRADVTLPAAESTHVEKVQDYDGKILIYYRAELYFADKEAQQLEATLAADSRWLDSLPAEALSACVPVDDRVSGADLFLLYDREGKTHVSTPTPADRHRYLLFSYFAEENMLLIAEFRCSHK